MASNDFVQSLIAELTTAGSVKSAADDDKGKKKDDDKDKKKDEKGDREDAFRERMKDKKDKDEDDKEKKAGALPVLDGSLLADLEALPQDLQKLASARATATFLADMARGSFGTGSGAPATMPQPTPVKEAAVAPTGGEEPANAADLFNHVFELHTAKLASADPEYAAILEHEQVKAAFNAGFEDQVLDLQQRMGVNPFAAAAGA